MRFLCQISDMHRTRMWIAGISGCRSSSGEPARRSTMQKISISYSGDPDSTVEEVNTDASGMSETLTLDTPPLELSMQPSEVQPYAEYTIQVTAKDIVRSISPALRSFSGQLSLQEIRMDAEETTESMTDNIVIPAHTLFLRNIRPRSRKPRSNPSRKPERSF